MIKLIRRTGTTEEPATLEQFYSEMQLKTLKQKLDALENFIEGTKLYTKPGIAYSLMNK
jgi:hypothetical protein